MKRKILVPLNRNFGATHFRMEIPASFFDPYIEVKYHRYKFDKYQALPFDVQNVAFKKLVGLPWDYAKWFEALLIVIQSKNYDAIWLSRSLLNFRNRLDRHLKDIIYDIDDAVWLEEAKYSFRSLCERANVVFAGNEYLAQQASKYTRNIEIVPTPVNLDIYRKLPIAVNEVFAVGWIGSSSGFKYLSGIEEPLATFFQHHKNSKLIIVADRFPRELTRLYKFIEFVKWSINTDVKTINSFSVGIMPIEDNEWGRGKCSFKMLQYMACEVPVIVSPVGMNKDVLKFSARHRAFGRQAVTGDNWSDVLDYYYSMSQCDREKEGKNGRNVVANEFGASMISNQIARHIQKYC